MSRLLLLTMACTGGGTTAAVPSWATDTSTTTDTGGFATVMVNLRVWEEDRSCWALWEGVFRREDWWGPWWDGPYGCGSADDGGTEDRHRYWLADEGLCMEVENPLTGDCAIPDPAVQPCDAGTIDCCSLPVRSAARCNPQGYQP